MVFDAQPTLTDGDLLLRPLVETDFKDLFEVASDPLIWEQHQNKDRYTEEVFSIFFEESIASNGALVIIDAKSEKIIGSSRFKVIDDADGVVEIGWSFLSRTHWGGHYNRKFKKIMVNYALQHFSHVVFYVHSKNYRSQKAMEKLGAVLSTDYEKAWVLEKDGGLTYVLTSPIKD